MFNKELWSKPTLNPFDALISIYDDTDVVSDRFNLFYTIHYESHGSGNIDIIDLGLFYISYTNPTFYAENGSTLWKSMSGPNKAPWNFARQHPYIAAAIPFTYYIDNLENYNNDYTASLVKTMIKDFGDNYFKVADNYYDGERLPFTHPRITEPMAFSFDQMLFLTATSYERLEFNTIGKIVDFVRDL